MWTVGGQLVFLDTFEKNPILISVFGTYLVENCLAYLAKPESECLHQFCRRHLETVIL